MQVVDPRGGTVVEPLRYDARLLRRDATVALLSNSYPDASRFLELVGDALRVDAPELRFEVFEKASTVGPAAPALVEEIAARADAVIAAYGHCGSCTSGTVRDAISFAARSIPAVALVTERFWDMSSFVAAGGGMEDVPRVLLPYPVAGCDDATLRSIAASAAPSILAALQGEV